MNISNERQNEILGNVLDWFSEHYEQDELLNILHDKLGMTDSEIDFFGFDFNNDIEDEKDLSIVHFHNDDEDYCLTTDAPFIFGKLLMHMLIQLRMLKTDGVLTILPKTLLMEQ